MTTEPALILATLAAAINAVQTAAITLPAWAHALIAVASILLTGLITRTQVTPTRAPAPTPAAPTGPRPL